MVAAQNQNIWLMKHFKSIHVGDAFLSLVFLRAPFESFMLSNTTRLLQSDRSNSLGGLNGIRHLCAAAAVNPAITST